MRVLLWDIDGTLLRSAGTGLRAMSRAVDDYKPALSALKGMRLDGMTDYGIARILCAARLAHERGGPLDDHKPHVAREEMEALLGRYLDALEEYVSEPGSYEILPGVVDMLDALSRVNGLVHALATGNVERGARLKLGEVYGRFRFGGFGSDAEHRPDVLRAAWTRAKEHLRRDVGAEEFVVIGDTPRDVSAAHALGMACMGVATGRYTAEELREAGADDVLESLNEADAASRILAATRRVRGGDDA